MSVDHISLKRLNAFKEYRILCILSIVSKKNLNISVVSHSIFLLNIVCRLRIGLYECSFNEIPI